MADNNSLLAFDAITAEINVTRKKVLFAQYSYKTKQYIVNKLYSETERIRKENEKIFCSLENMRQRIKFSQRNLKSLHNAVISIESINCTLKVVLIQTQVKKSKLKQSMDMGLKKYNAKWIQDKHAYESSPVVQEKLRLMREVGNKKFQYRRLILDKKHLVNIFKNWIIIAKKQSQYAIIQFAIHVITWPRQIKELKVRKGCLRQLVIQIKALTQQNTAVLAELDEISVNRTLYRINKNQLTSRHLQFKSIFLNVDDDLPNLTNFCEGFKSELLLLQIPRIIEQKSEQMYELNKFISHSSNKPKDFKGENNYFLLKTDKPLKTTMSEAGNKMDENSEFEERCSSYIVEHPKQNKTITILRDVILNPKTNLLNVESQVPLNEANQFSQTKAINRGGDDDVALNSNEERVATKTQTTFTTEDHDEDSCVLLPPTQFRPTPDLKQMDASDQEYTNDKNDGDTQNTKSAVMSQCEETIRTGFTVDRSVLENTSDNNINCSVKASDENYTDMMKYKLHKDFKVQQSPSRNFSNTEPSLWGNCGVHETTSKFFNFMINNNEGASVSTDSTQKEVGVIAYGYDDNIVSKSTSTSNKNNDNEHFEELKGESIKCLRDPNMYSLDLNLPLSDSQLISDDSTLDCSNLDTPSSLLLSPKGNDNELFLHNNDADGVTGSHFLFGSEKSNRGAFKMFGGEDSKKEDGDSFTFKFTSPEAKKKKNSFFNLFE